MGRAFAVPKRNVLGGNSWNGTWPSRRDCITVQRILQCRNGGIDPLPNWGEGPPSLKLRRDLADLSADLSAEALAQAEVRKNAGGVTSS
jgi:hypothetical protein